MPPANHDHRNRSSALTSSVRKRVSASFSTVVPALYPSVMNNVRPSSKSSDACAVRPPRNATRAASATTPAPASTARWPENIVAISASRYASRASPMSTRSSREAAFNIRGDTSLSRLRAKAIWPNRASSCALRKSSSGPRSATAASPAAASNAPARRFASAPRSARRARRDGSTVRATDRSKNAPAAAYPPRDCARAAEASSSAATVSLGRTVACARCHARRSGSELRSVASAKAAWASLYP